MREFKTVRVIDYPWVVDFQYQDEATLVQTWALDHNEMTETFEQSFETTESVLRLARNSPTARVEELILPDFLES